MYCFVTTPQLANLWFFTLSNCVISFQSFNFDGSSITKCSVRTSLGSFTGNMKVEPEWKDRLLYVLLLYHAHILYPGPTGSLPGFWSFSMPFANWSQSIFLACLMAFTLFPLLPQTLQDLSALVFLHLIPHSVTFWLHVCFPSHSSASCSRAYALSSPFRSGPREYLFRQWKRGSVVAQ